MRSTRISFRIDARRAEVHRALLDEGSARAWMVPDGMTSRVHAIDPRFGGAFRISLFHDAPTGADKSTAGTDIFNGRFVELVSDERVVQVVESESNDAAMRHEMRITYALADAEGGTELVAVDDDLPPGLPPETNEEGWPMSLWKVSRLVESR